MFERIDVMNMARAMTGHAAERQAVVARNIANADTPGYLARDVTPFADSYDSISPAPLRGTDPRHLVDPVTERVFDAVPDQVEEPDLVHHVAQLVDERPPRC